MPKRKERSRERIVGRRMGRGSVTVHLELPL